MMSSLQQLVLRKFIAVFITLFVLLGTITYFWVKDFYIQEAKAALIEDIEIITLNIHPDTNFDTLAQNIYYLLSDGFFMEKGIGEYINNRLKQFLSKVNEGTLNPEEEKEFRYIIENIGDTVLRNKLLQIVENKNFYKGKLKV